MSDFRPAPKRTMRLDAEERAREKRVAKLVKAWQRKPLARTPIMRSRRPIPQVNARAAKRRHVNYRKVIASDFNKHLRYDAFLRSGGYCECDMCRDIRSLTMSRAAVGATAAEIERAHTVIPAWFIKRGGEPWRRFRSTDGELHHDSYKYFGDENPDEIRFVRWVWDSCHQRIEAQHGTRRRFLHGK